MAISRVPGFSLLPNLDRQGVDLQFTTDGNALVTMDFTQFRLGVNEASPSEALSVNGNILVSNGHVYTSANLAYNIGSLTNYWNNLYIGNISVINDLRVAGTFDIDGNLFTANITGNVINADAIYENGYQVLTTNTTITINGAATGSGDYSNVYITLENSGVVAGSYGDTEFVPQINVNDKGLTTSASNIVLSRIGNLRVADTTISAGDANLVLTANTGLVSLDNNSIIDLADPIDNQDAATKAYVDSQISSSGSRIISDDTEVAVHDDGINPGYVTVTVDGNLIANITETNTEFYNSVGTGIIGFAGNTITSTGNINLNLPGIIRVQGDGAMRIPTGDNATRPLNPETGFLRFNTDRDSIEYYDGVDWDIPGDFTVTSDVLPTDGVSNTFSISANTTTAGVLVSINGTMQQPGNAYTVTGNVITFVETPLTTDVIEVRTIGAGGVSIESIGLLNSEVSVDGTNVNIKGNLLPTANITYSIGSETLWWKDLYLSGNTIYIGGTQLTVSNGILFVGEEEVLGGFESNVLALESNVSTLQSDVSSLESNVSTLQSDVSSLESNVSTLQSDVSSLESNVSTLQSDVSSLESNVSTLQSDVSSLESNVSILQGDISTLTSNAAVQAGLIADTNTAIATANTAMKGYVDNEISSLIDSAPDALNTLNELAAALGDDANLSTTLTTMITNVESNVSILQGNVSTLQGDVSSLESNVSILQGDVSSLESNAAVQAGLIADTNTAITTANVAMKGYVDNATDLDNLLPSGEQTGYVLKTSGAGTYYWSAESGGGSVVGQELNTLRQSNTATSGQTIFTLVDGKTYTPGAGQLRVYINGVRQFPDAYTETSANVYTLSTGVNAGTIVFAEIDQFSSFNNYANLTYASNIGNIAAVGLTVQSAIENLETNKATLADPVFTGTPTAPTASSGTNTTQIATTAFVENANVALKGYTDTQLATKANLANPTFSGNITVTGNVNFTGWHVYETNNTLYFAFGGNVKMSLNTSGNLTVSGDVTGFGTP